MNIRICRNPQYDEWVRNPDRARTIDGNKSSGGIGRYIGGGDSGAKDCRRILFPARRTGRHKRAIDTVETRVSRLDSAVYFGLSKHLRYRLGYLRPSRRRAIAPRTRKLCSEICTDAQNREHRRIRLGVAPSVAAIRSRAQGFRFLLERPRPHAGAPPMVNIRPGTFLEPEFPLVLFTRHIIISNPNYYAP